MCLHVVVGGAACIKTDLVMMANMTETNALSIIPKMVGGLAGGSCITAQATAGVEGFPWACTGFGICSASSCAGEVVCCAAGSKCARLQTDTHWASDANWVEEQMKGNVCSYDLH